jgi:hypothetical protein
MVRPGLEYGVILERAVEIIRGVLRCRKPLYRLDEVLNAENEVSNAENIVVCEGKRR